MTAGSPPLSAAHALGWLADRLRAARRGGWLEKLVTPRESDIPP
jgi:hypothetical protein